MRPLDLAGDREGGEDDGQVGLNRVAWAVEHGRGAQVGLAHPEGLIHLPQSWSEQITYPAGINAAGVLVT